MSASPDTVCRRRVAIVDYRLGNLFSIERACATVGLSAAVTDDPHRIATADAVILPGMGAFGDAMENLRRLDLIAPLQDVAAANRPLVGVCLGLQLLLSESDEFGTHRGLGLIEGVVRRLAPAEGGAKVPQIGWNAIEPARSGAWRDTALAGIAPGARMYFVHSYCAAPEDDSVTIARTSYGGHTYCSALRRGAIEAFQFHPEKSGPAGLSIYRAIAARLLVDASP